MQRCTSPALPHVGQGLRHLLRVPARGEFRLLQQPRAAREILDDLLAAV